MNSIHRVGLTLATLAAVTTVAGSFVVQGYMAAEQAAASQASADIAAQAAPTIGPEIVYVSSPSSAPVPSADPAGQVQAAAQVQPVSPVVQPQIIHVVVPAPGDDDGSDG